jgi:plastocyanin
MTGRIASLLAICAFALGACAGAPASTPAGTPAVTLELSAQNSKFDLNQVEVIANAPFAIHFRNLDTVPHNVSIRGAAQPMTTELFSGPGERTYVYAALPTGTYTFVCDLHPEMTGTLLSN